MSDLVLVGLGYAIILVKFSAVAIIADTVSVIIYDPPVFKE